MASLFSSLLFLQAACSLQDAGQLVETTVPQEGQSADRSEIGEAKKRMLLGGRLLSKAAAINNQHQHSYQHIDQPPR